MPFGDLELHGHSDIFDLGVNQSRPMTSSAAKSHISQGLGTTSWSMV